MNFSKRSKISFLVIALLVLSGAGIALGQNGGALFKKIWANVVTGDTATVRVVDQNTIGKDGKDGITVNSISGGGKSIVTSGGGFARFRRSDFPTTIIGDTITVQAMPLGTCTGTAMDSATFGATKDLHISCAGGETSPTPSPTASPSPSPSPPPTSTMGRINAEVKNNTSDVDSIAGATVHFKTAAGVDAGQCVTAIGTQLNEFGSVSTSCFSGQFPVGAIYRVWAEKGTKKSAEITSNQIPSYPQYAQVVLVISEAAPPPTDPCADHKFDLDLTVKDQNGDYASEVKVTVYGEPDTIGGAPAQAKLPGGEGTTGNSTLVLRDISIPGTAGPFGWARKYLNYSIKLSGNSDEGSTFARRYNYSDFDNYDDTGKFTYTDLMRSHCVLTKTFTLQKIPGGPRINFVGKVTDKDSSNLVGEVKLDFKVKKNDGSYLILDAVTDVYNPKDQISATTSATALENLWNSEGSGIPTPDSVKGVNYQAKGVVKTRDDYDTLLGSAMLEVAITPPDDYYYDTNNNNTFESGTDNKLTANNLRTLAKDIGSGNFGYIGTTLLLPDIALKRKTVATPTTTATATSSPTQVDQLHIFGKISSKDDGSYVGAEIETWAQSDPFGPNGRSSDQKQDLYTESNLAPSEDINYDMLVDNFQALDQALKSKNLKFTLKITPQDVGDGTDGNGSFVNYYYDTNGNGKFDSKTDNTVEVDLSKATIHPKLNSYFIQVDLSLLKNKTSRRRAGGKLIYVGNLLSVNKLSNLFPKDLVSIASPSGYLESSGWGGSVDLGTIAIQVPVSETEQKQLTAKLSLLDSFGEANGADQFFTIDKFSLSVSEFEYLSSLPQEEITKRTIITANPSNPLFRDVSLSVEGINLFRDNDQALLIIYISFDHNPEQVQNICLKILNRDGTPLSNYDIIVHPKPTATGDLAVTADKVFNRTIKDAALRKLSDLKVRSSPSGEAHFSLQGLFDQLNFYVEYQAKSGEIKQELIEPPSPINSSTFTADTLDLQDKCYEYKVSKIVTLKPVRVITLNFKDAKTGSTINPKNLYTTLFSSDPVTHKTIESYNNPSTINCRFGNNQTTNCGSFNDITLITDSQLKLAIDADKLKPIEDGAKEYSLDDFIFNFSSYDGQLTSVNKGDYSAFPDNFTLYLSSKTESNLIYCEKIGGIDFCAIWALKDSIFTDLSRANMAKASRLIQAFYASFAKPESEPIDILPIDILILPPEEYRSFASGSNSMKSGSFDSDFYIALEQNYFLNGFGTEGARTIVHEFGHILEGEMLKNGGTSVAAPGSDVDKLVKGIKPGSVNTDPKANSKFYYNLHDAFEAVKKTMCHQYKNKYACFTEYADTTNESELWAEFFTYYILNNQALQNAMNDTSIPEECRNSLKFMYQLLKEKLPGFETFQYNFTDCFGIDCKTISKANQKNVAYAAGKSDLEIAMEEFGYGKVTVADLGKIFGGGLSQESFSADEILNGDWLQENYDKKTFSEKAKIQYQRLVEPIFAVFTVPNLQNAARLFNSWVDTELTKLGLLRNVGSISGTVFDENGNPVTNATVQIGPCLGTTGGAGRFVLTKVPVGVQTITRIENKDGIHDIVSVAPSSDINVQNAVTTNISVTVKNIPTSNSVPNS